ncbi:hypothetical protein BaRGS_00010995 [Batillaria attramentaria]|uniref:Uncharacterized protein n=1 Tax=Batillaria attramentaria TaxID=370345 RepID=A0ABD0LEG2_9CAEN
MWMDRKMTYQTCWISQAGKTGQQVYVRFSLTAVILWTIIVNVSAASGQKIDVTTVEPLDMTNTPGSVIMGQTYSPSGRPEPSAGRQEQTTSSSTSEVILDSGRIERNVTCTPQLTETCPVSGGLLEVHCWLKGSRGQITWTEPSDSCWRHVHWHIASPSDQMGIVLDLNSLHSGLWEAFDIFTVDQTTRQRVIIPRSYKESPFIPRLIHNSHVVVLISTRPNAFSRPFSFSLSYYAHPIDRMPILVPVPAATTHIP